MIRAPAESMSQKIGSSSDSARSVTRMIFSTVRAPHEPGLDGRVVGDDERRTSVDQTLAGDHAVGGQAGAECVGELTVLDEAAVVEQQRDSLAHVELVLRRQLRGRLVRRRERRFPRSANLLVAAHAAGAAAHRRHAVLVSGDQNRASNLVTRYQIRPRRGSPGAPARRRRTRAGAGRAAGAAPGWPRRTRARRCTLCSELSFRLDVRMSADNRAHSSCDQRCCSASTSPRRSPNSASRPGISVSGRSAVGFGGRIREHGVQCCGAPPVFVPRHAPLRVESVAC